MAVGDTRAIGYAAVIAREPGVAHARLEPSASTADMTVAQPRAVNACRAAAPQRHTMCINNLHIVDGNNKVIRASALVRRAT